jgi:predicted RNase H-like HicB family nuclease
MALQNTVNATIRRGEEYYVAECQEIGVVTQGDTLNETVSNLKEAVNLHLEGEDLAGFGLALDPWILLTVEL